MHTSPHTHTKAVRAVVSAANEGWLDSLTVRSTLASDLASAELRVFAYFNKAQQRPTSGTFQVYIEGKLVLEVSAAACAPAPESPMAGLYVGSWSTQSPRLWWPRGHGKQPLYTVELRYVAPGGGVKATLTKRVGLRSVRLVEAPDSDEPAPVRGTKVPVNKGETSSSASSACLMGQPAAAPASFYFEINNLPIYMRGGMCVCVYVCVYVCVCVFVHRMPCCTRSCNVRRH